MLPLFLLAAFLTQDTQVTTPSTPAKTQDEQQTMESSRCANAGETPDQRVALPRTIAPGPPPVLSFRVYEGKRHGQFQNSDLMLDDAGH